MHILPIWVFRDLFNLKIEFQFIINTLLTNYQNVSFWNPLISVEINFSVLAIISLYLYHWTTWESLNKWSWTSFTDEIDRQYTCRFATKSSWFRASKTFKRSTSNTLRKEKIAKGKNAKSKNANEWPKNLSNAELQNANQLIVFGNAELKIAIHRFFVKWENKNCEVLSKNWKTLHLVMLILARTNYIS